MVMILPLRGIPRRVEGRAGTQSSTLIATLNERDTTMNVHNLPQSNAAMLLSYDEATALAEALTMIHRLAATTAAGVIGKLDIEDGDADLEPNGDDEPAAANGDTQDAAYGEWHTKPANLRRKGQSEILAGHEDDEEDDAPEEDDGDSAVDDQPCDEPYQDLEEEPGVELEQMIDDVPMLPVVSAEYNVFNDQRTPLGIGNLQSSFVGVDIRSADTGAVHTGRSPSLTSRPGTPV